jgi:membrane fusion protein (multidrug efflux system)
MVISRLSVFLSISLMALSGCAKKNAAPAAGARSGANAQVQPVEVTTVVRRDLVEMQNVIGSLAANESATIRPEINGLIREIRFNEGQRVKKGDLLVKLDDSELRAQLAQSEARHELAKLNLARAENLRQTQSNTQADVDRSRSEFAAAVADLELLKVRLARTEIRAPFDGAAEARALSPGDYVNPQSVLTILADLSRMKIEFQVPERFLGKVGVGSKFVVLSRNDESAVRTSEKIEGEVYFVSSTIDRATRSSQVKGYLSQVPPRMRPGMFANVELVLSVKKDALTVTEGAILTTPRGAQIIAVRDQGADKVADFVSVKLGLRSRGYVEIEPIAPAKLDDKQSVVASGVGALILFPGAKLEPRPQKEQFRVGGSD